MSISTSINNVIVNALEALAEERGDDLTVADQLTVLADRLDCLFVENGRVGKQVFTCESKDGTRMCHRFSIAVDEWQVNDDGEWEKTGTDWSYVDHWHDAQADFEWLEKGTPVLVVGFWDVSEWVDDDGEEHSRDYVNALRVIPAATRPERKQLNEERKAKKATAPKASKKKAGKISQLLS